MAAGANRNESGEQSGVRGTFELAVMSENLLDSAAAKEVSQCMRADGADGKEPEVSRPAVEVGAVPI